jgi:hypothetical protein
MILSGQEILLEQWVESFKSKPKFWNSIRSKTEKIQKDFKNIKALSELQPVICRVFSSKDLFYDWKP